jgi:putative membrane protein (TIGR04086 family)
VDHVTQGRLYSLRRFPILYGLAWAMFIAVLGTLLVSFCAHFGSLSDSGILVSAYIVHCLAVIFGGISASRCKRERGWYYGGITGLIYAILMVIIGIIVYNTFSLDTSGIFRVLLMAVIGAFSGIIGVNTVRDE